MGKILAIDLGTQIEADLLGRSPAAYRRSQDSPISSSVRSLVSGSVRQTNSEQARQTPMKIRKAPPGWP